MRRGFTLIELLIVVAIIAILAAIAVPNFLEAQVRSKVARAKSDMRTYSIAINAYMVDSNRPPLGYNETDHVFHIGPGARQYCYKFLTTPIAYLTSLPTDPFCLKEARTEFTYYMYNNFKGPKKDFSWNPDGLDKILNKGYLWCMYSLGPARADDAPWVEDMLVSDPGQPNYIAGAGMIYDPTNGTVSKGKIYLTNKGPLTVPY